MIQFYHGLWFMQLESLTLSISRWLHALSDKVRLYPLLHSVKTMCTRHRELNLSSRHGVNTLIWMSSICIYVLRMQYRGNNGRKRKECGKELKDSKTCPNAVLKLNVILKWKLFQSLTLKWAILKHFILKLLIITEGAAQWQGIYA